HRLDGLGHGAGVAGAVREEEAVGLPGEDGLQRRPGREHAHGAAAVAERAEDVPLDAVVVDGDALRVRALAEGVVVGLGAGDAAGELEAGHARERPRLRHEAGVVEVLRRDDGVHDAPLADVADEPPGVHAGDADEAVAAHVGVEALLGVGVGGDLGEGADDEAGHHRAVGLGGGVEAAVVPDVGVRHHHDLPVVAGVGQDLLVPAHRGVEAQLAARLPARSDGAAGDDGAVLESELGERAGVRIRDLRHGGWIQKKPPNGRLRRGRRGGRDRGSRLGCEAGCDRASGGTNGFRFGPGARAPRRPASDAKTTGPRAPGQGAGAVFTTRSPGRPEAPVARPIRRVILPYANGNDPPVHPLMPRRPPTDPAARERLYQTRALGGLAASVLVVLAAFRLWPAAPGPTLADFERVERPREQVDIELIEPTVQRETAPPAPPPPPQDVALPPVEVPDERVVEERVAVIDLPALEPTVNAPPAPPSAPPAPP